MHRPLPRGSTQLWQLWLQHTVTSASQHMTLQCKPVRLCRVSGLPSQLTSGKTAADHSVACLIWQAWDLLSLRLQEAATGVVLHSSSSCPSASLHMTSLSPPSSISLCVLRIYLSSFPCYARRIAASSVMLFSIKLGLCKGSVS